MKPFIVQQMNSQRIMNKGVHKDETKNEGIGLYWSIATSG